LLELPAVSKNLVTASQTFARIVLAMSKRVLAFVVVIGLGVAAAAAYRTTSRADAAPGDCYSDAKGPSEPTVCN
jgi:hypothetical protein